MNPTSRWIGPGIVSALLVPAILTHAFTPDDRSGLGLTCAPFGWQVVMIVHLVASLPIGLVTSAALVRSSRRQGRWAASVAWALVGLAGISAIVLLGEHVATAFEWSRSGLLARGIARSIFAYLLVLPWLIVAVRWDGPDVQIPNSWAAVLVGTTLAVLPPLVYEDRIVESRAIELADHVGTGRLLKARSALVGLRDLGGRRPGGVMSPAEALRGLEATLSRAALAAARELPATATPEARMERAFLLIQLDRLDEAESILLPLSETMPDATLLLAAVYRDRSRWSDSERAYRRALAWSLPGAARDRGSLDRSATAYEGLAEAARSGGRPEDAERAYQEARRRLPARAGYFAFQLGRHYLSGGRPADGIAQLRQAVHLDPTLEDRVRPLILQAKVRTPACLLRSVDR